MTFIENHGRHTKHMSTKTQSILWPSLLLLVLLFLLPTLDRARASTQFTAQQSGLWNSPATWGNSGTSQPGVTIPGPDSNVLIPTDITVQIGGDSGQQIQQLTVQSSATLGNAPGCHQLHLQVSGDILNYGTIRGQNVPIILQVAGGRVYNAGIIAVYNDSGVGPSIELSAEDGLVFNEGIITAGGGMGGSPGGAVWLHSNDGEVLNRGLIYGGDSQAGRGGPVILSAKTVILCHGRVGGGRQRANNSRGKVAIVASGTVAGSNSYTFGQQISLAVGFNGVFNLENLPEGGLTAGTDGLWISGRSQAMLDLQGNSHRFAPLHSLGGSITIQADSDRRVLDPSATWDSLSAPQATLQEGSSTVRPIIWFTEMPDLQVGKTTAWRGVVVNVGNTTGAVNMKVEAPEGWQSSFVGDDIIPLLARHSAEFRLTLSPPAHQSLQVPVTLTVRGAWAADATMADSVPVTLEVEGERRYFPLILNEGDGRTIAAFIVPKAAKPGEPIKLYNNSSGRSPLQYRWDFADCHGETTVANPQPVCPNGGWRTFTLHVTGPGGEDEISKPVHADGPPRPQLTWEGAENGPAVWGEVRLLGWDTGNERDIQQALFQYWQGDHWVLIGDGVTAGDRPAPNAWQVSWSTTALPPGIYPVRLWLVDNGGQQSSYYVSLAVEKLPHPVATVTSWLGQNVTLSAASSFDLDNEIIAYRWYFGDGTTGEGITVTHSYASSGPYVVRLQLEDATHLVGEETYTLDVSARSWQRVTQCGCQGMRIRYQGSSDLPFPWLANNRYALGALTTSQSPLLARVQWEVEATLTPGSNVNACWSHEKARGSVSWSSYNGAKGEDYQLSGLSYASSSRYFGFHGQRDAGLGQSRGGESIHWTGFAGWGTTAPSGLGIDRVTFGDNGTTLIATYRAQVAGDAGQCSCTWDVATQIDKSGAIVETPRIENVRCTP